MNGLLFGTLNPMVVGPSFAVVLTDGYTLIAQSGAYPRLNGAHNGRLIVMRGGEIIGRLDNIGSARQMVVQNRVAYITSREDGLFIVDISNPESPKLLCHYDTCEYATGIAVSGDLLAVSLRQYGLEFIDVSDPARPRFVSLARTGEAQSLCLDGKYAYAGVWGSRELVIVDISDLSNPFVAARAPLDGRGDGVAVRNGICYAATGHHARPPVGVINPDPALWQKMGNGLELFDVTDPTNPRKLSGVKFPPYYGLTFDMWQVKLSGNIALVSDTRNGLFAVDISDQLAPAVLDRIQLPEADGGTPDPIASFDYSGDTLVLAGGERDSYTLSLSKALAPAHVSLAGVSPRGARAEAHTETLSGVALNWKFTLNGHCVKYAADGGDRLFVACSGEGVFMCDKLSFDVLGVMPSSGFVSALVWREPYLYAAEGERGLRVYKREGDALKFISAFEYKGRAAFDLQLSGDGRYLLVQIASLGAALLSLDDPENPRLIGEKLDFIGLFYGRHFPARGFGRECFLGSNRDGLFRLRAGAGGLEFENFSLAEDFGFGPASGIEVAGDKLFAVSGGGYITVPLACAQTSPARRKLINGVQLVGKPRLCGDLLIVTERAKGLITALDVKDIDNPRPVFTARTSASPDLALIIGARLYIPGGRFGLMYADIDKEGMI